MPGKGRKDVPVWRRWRGRSLARVGAFTDEFKADIVERCLNGDRSVGQVAKDFDLTETAVRAWVRAGRDRRRHSDDGLTTDEKEELSRAAAGEPPAA